MAWLVIRRLAASSSLQHKLVMFFKLLELNMFYQLPIC
ncbi:MAG: hypothetical protein OFPII_39220 [Osedax symbiont Rs1]|nr:MAG: hypothetical protein OFPII_39220 [Osedax symbiont Rs1]